MNSPNKDISIFVKAIIEALLYGVCSNQFCCELSSGFSETFDTDGNRHPCVSLMKYDVDDSLVKSCNSKDNEVCNGCWARNICKDCIVQYITSEETQPYKRGQCYLKKHYDYTLQRLVEILEESEENFQRIIDHYKYF